MVTEKPLAIVLTDGLLQHTDAKTAHGLIRGTDRFSIAAVIDSMHAGKDAGEVLDGQHRNIPVLPDVATAFGQIPGIQFCIIGVATVGGVLPAHFLPVIEACIRHGISIVNGLHDFLNDRPDLAALAARHGVSLIDIRRPKQRSELHFWDASIFSVTAPVIAVLGTDCALGKRTTCRMITQALAQQGVHAEMIYTGQTGWMQGIRYGFIFDSTLNDFIAGELEHAIVSCWKETNAAVILIEGQSALRNPSGPCGSEMLISGNAKHVVLVHAPKRKYYDDIPGWGAIHSLASEVALIKMYGAEVLAIALNTEHCSLEEALAFQKEFSASLQLPVLLPLQQGVGPVVPLIQSLLKEKL
jgi:uncharacterized NAD-dependent epimerase/dehydratase family protein